ncbi:DMT family transporter [Rhodoferax sp. U11-2br]|uniref:DMT family transporter n=1 Tax=Rhodoferax sp. U11-2br TaxID=2838878 RepID=UPI001BECAE8B|nr:DMT family transporter [Rhodoferax sp. U11-2br]MBT3066616.1 EamA family transporter [Rhodoferax sp. U11-2br]
MKPNNLNQRLSGEHAVARATREGWVSVLIAATLWGTTGVIFHALGTSSDGANAVSISFLRLALSVPFFLVIARLHVGTWLTPLAPRSLVVLIVLGLAMAFYQLTYVMAIERVGVAISVLISICGAPIFVALISVLALGERLKAQTIIALVVSIVGTVLLVGLPTEINSDTSRFWMGVAIAIACGVCQAFYVLAARSAVGVCSPMHAGGISFAFGALALLPFGLYEGLQLTYSVSGWAMLLYVAAVPTALAQTLFLIGIRGTGAVGGAIASLLEPLVATVLAVILLHERMTWLGMLGAAILLSGIVLIQWTPIERTKESKLIMED